MCSSKKYKVKGLAYNHNKIFFHFFLDIVQKSYCLYYNKYTAWVSIISLPQSLVLNKEGRHGRSRRIETLGLNYLHRIWALLLIQIWIELSFGHAWGFASITFCNISPDSTQIKMACIITLNFLILSRSSQMCGNLCVCVFRHWSICFHACEFCDLLFFLFLDDLYTQPHKANLIIKLDLIQPWIFQKIIIIMVSMSI